MMRTLSTILFVFLLTVSAAAQQPNFDQVVAPFLKKHCIRCHGNETAESDLRLDQMSGDLEKNEQAEIWEGVLDQLASGDMPPKERPRPSTEEVSLVTRWIKQKLESAVPLLTSRHIGATIRRLNRNEYNNTIRDLFDIEFEAGEGFPQDDSAHGFDNVGEALTLSPLLLEKYLREAEHITERVVLSKRAEPVLGHWPGKELVYFKSRRASDGEKATFHTVGRSNGGGAFFPLKIPFKTKGYVTSAPGRYRVRIKAHPEGPQIGPGSRWRIVYHPKDFETTPEGCESPRLLVVCNGEFAGRIHLEKRAPQVYEIETWAEAGQEFGFTFENGVGGIKKSEYSKYTGAAVVFHWVEIEGPLYDQWPSKGFRKLFFGDTKTEQTPEYAQEILRRFALRAYRRPASEFEVKELFDIFTSERAAGSRFEESIAVALQRALCSPHFLYLVEPSPEKRSERPLDGYELASRLSYFLWSSMPDEILFEAAADGSLLKDPEPQVRRMLKDPKSQALVGNFTGQWLKLRHVQDIAVDRQLYPDFTDYLRTLFVQETETFFREILEHDLSILNFLDSDFAMLNDRLAYHYGIKGIVGSQFRRVKLDETSHRGGLMTHGSVLMLTTCGTRTSPILRGVWVRENLLGLPVPPPPKDVPELPAAPRGRVSQRERLEAHRAIKACARCHDRIDPLGLPLEHYDVIGRWRSDYSINTRYGRRGGPPVDGATELTSGERVDGPDALRRLLATRKELFCRGFVEKLLIYALGRGLTLSDRPTVDALVQSLEKSEYKMSDLMVEISKSKQFTTK